MKNVAKKIFSLILVAAICSCLVIQAVGYPDYYPNTHRNTGSHIADLIGVAKTQLGYTELDSSGHPISSSSDGGYTKYGAYFGEPNGAWCAYFISWCASQANIPSSVVPRLGSCGSLTEWYRSRSRYYTRSSGYIPKPGDMVFFNWSGGTSAEHIGIVTGVSGNNLYTIEGNTGGGDGNMCNGRTRGLKSSYVLGYGVPNYNDAATYVGSYAFAASVSATAGGRSDSTSYSSGRLSVYTSSATNITCTDAMLNGSVKNSDNLNISEIGFYFGSEKNKLKKYPELTNQKDEQIEISMSIAEKFGALVPNTTYYYRAYVMIKGSIYTGPMYAVVTVSDKPKQLVLSESSMNIGIGQTAEIMWAQLPLGSKDEGVTWTSTDANVADIDENGIVYGKNYGRATITGTTNYGSAFSSFSVNVLIGKPENIQLANVTGDKIKLSWNTVEKAKGYVVYRCETADGKYSEIAKLDGDEGEYIDGNVKKGQRYYYKLQTLAEKEIYNSDITEVMYITAKLPAPQVHSENDENGFGKITWNKVKGAEKYIVYRARQVDGVYLAICEVRGKSFTDFSAASAGFFFYKVVAVSDIDSANSNFSDVAVTVTNGADADAKEIETVKVIERQKELIFNEENILRRQGEVGKISANGCMVIR